MVLYAVFNNLGTNLLLLSTARGAGIAVNSKTTQETFMKMISAGGGLGTAVSRAFCERSRNFLSGSRMSSRMLVSTAVMIARVHSRCRNQPSGNRVWQSSSSPCMQHDNLSIHREFDLGAWPQSKPVA